MLTSTTHLVLIPSYNPGAKVYDTVRSARRQWKPVWVIIDGSTDDTVAGLTEMALEDTGLRLVHIPRNAGKGMAVLYGLDLAAAAGYTHVLTMDADGQHPANLIPDFMATSAAQPQAMVLGKPVFDASAPSIRIKGRKISNWWTDVETLYAGIGDSLFGFRIYPIAPLRKIMHRQPWMRRFDFDPEAAIRLSWSGVPAINIDAPVRYFRPDEGGVSHFKYLRDNVLLTFMHIRLVFGFVLRLPLLLGRKRQRQS